MTYKAPVILQPQDSKASEVTSGQVPTNAQGQKIDLWTSAHKRSGPENWLVGADGELM